MPGESRYEIRPSGRFPAVGQLRIPEIARFRIAQLHRHGWGTVDADSDGPSHDLSLTQLRNISPVPQFLASRQTTRVASSKNEPLLRL